jgi:hypothetical protein
MTTSDGELTGRVAEEIRRLRKGHGLQAGDLDARLGPLLRELAGDARMAARRKVLTAEIERLSAELPGDFRMATRASLALSAETIDEPHFTKRVGWLASRIHHENRTALRRIERAEQRLAELIAAEIQRRRGRVPAAPEGWYIAKLKTVLRLDAGIIESEEDRCIVATRENLTEVMAWMDLPGDADQRGADLQARIRYGGSLLQQERPSPGHFKFVVRLPEPLQAGDEHRYGLMLRMPRQMLRLPHYLVVPECKCEKFNLTIRFDSQRLPRWIRRVEGETVRTFENPRRAGDLLVPDAAGEIHQEFSDLSLYLGYGIQWEPIDWDSGT